MPRSRTPRRKRKCKNLTTNQFSQDAITEDILKFRLGCSADETIRTSIVAAVVLLFRNWAAKAAPLSDEKRSYHLAACLSVVLKYAEDDVEIWCPSPIKCIRLLAGTKDADLQEWTAAEWRVLSCASSVVWETLWVHRKCAWWGAREDKSARSRLEGA